MLNGNGSRNLIQIVLAVFLAINAVVGGYVIYRIKELDSMAQQVFVNTERISRLETLVDNLPAKMAVQAATLDMIAKSLEKIEKKLDEHIEKSR
jgi:hypothetical protein